MMANKEMLLIRVYIGLKMLLLLLANDVHASGCSSCTSQSVFGSISNTLTSHCCTNEFGVNYCCSEYEYVHGVANCTQDSQCNNPEKPDCCGNTCCARVSLSCSESYDCFYSADKPHCCHSRGKCCTNSEYSLDLCFSNHDCQTYYRPMCCSDNVCCTTVRYQEQHVSSCVNESDCLLSSPSKRRCCSDGICCTQSKYDEETKDAEIRCYRNSECKWYQPYCCSNHKCCSKSEYDNQIDSDKSITSQYCSGNSDCLTSSKPYCCSDYKCCTEAKYDQENNVDPTSRSQYCYGNSDCLTSSKPYCCSDYKCCTEAKYDQENNVDPPSSCYWDYDCAGSLKPYCCSDKQCCSESEHDLENSENSGDSPSSCYWDYDCAGSLKPYCCSDKQCCSKSEHDLENSGDSPSSCYQDSNCPSSKPLCCFHQKCCTESEYDSQTNKGVRASALVGISLAICFSLGCFIFGCAYLCKKQTGHRRQLLINSESTERSTRQTTRTVQASPPHTQRLADLPIPMPPPYSPRKPETDIPTTDQPPPYSAVVQGTQSG